MEFKKSGHSKLKKAKKITRKKSLETEINHSIRASYFARFRFNLDELLSYLRDSSGKLYANIPLVYQCLDDLGYWGFVRASEIFHFTEELESSLKAQFNLLEKTFDYNISDVLLWGSLSQKDHEKFLVKITEKILDGDQELFRVEVLESGASFLATRFELDYWNAAGSSLPVDSLVEVIDWSKDQFWQKRLDDFKVWMVSNDFKFNFLTSDSDILLQQELLIQKIQDYFTLNNGDLFQKNRGIGLLSCGSGSEQDRMLVLTFAFQALAQSFGIAARLWGRTTRYEGIPVLINIQTSQKRSYSSIEFFKQISNEKILRPIQRPLSEVLMRVLAKGPFGQWESLSYVKIKESDNNEVKEGENLSEAADSDR